MSVFELGWTEKDFSRRGWTKFTFECGGWAISEFKNTRSDMLGYPDTINYTHPDYERLGWSSAKGVTVDARDGSIYIGHFVGDGIDFDRPAVSISENEVKVRYYD